MLLPIDDLSCEVLILGAGGAGMLAALHVTTANPCVRIVIIAAPLAASLTSKYTNFGD